MQDSDMAMGEEAEESSKMSLEHSRPRTKKKSTLTKLKEKKLREMGSVSSLQAENSIESSSKSQSDTGVHETKSSGESFPNGDKKSSKEDFYTFSTKDPPELIAASVKEGRPKPKPRGRRQSSDIESKDSSMEKSRSLDANDGEKNSQGQRDSVGSDGSTLQMLRDLKMGADQPESVDSVSQSNFVPRPPATPRTPRSTPRTPRGYSVVVKGEKRTREPGSADENEVEEKKEKNSLVSSKPGVRDSGASVNTSTWASETDTLTTVTHSAMSVDEEDSETLSPSRRLPGQAKYGERLLKRRSSSDTTGEAGGSQEDRAKGKPPINRSLTNTSSHQINNNNNHSSSNKSATTSTSKPNDVTESPGNKYLKSTKKSQSENLPRQNSDKIEAQLASGINLSSPSHLSVNTASRRSSASELSQTTDALHMQYERLLLSDVDNGNKSTKVLYTSESPRMVRSITSPPTSARLEPLSPRTQPPPLTGEFSSRSLRTAYKIDPNVRPNTGSGRTGTQGDKSDSGAHSNGDRLSQKSFASGSVLPVITTKEARSRSFLEGSVSSGSPSMVGAEELERYFPERKVNVLVGTWNMNELKDVTSSLDDFILPEKCDYIQDIYAIGTQENAMSKKEWEIKLQETLGPSHVMFHSVSHGSLHLVVYIRRDLIWFCSTPEDDVISLRAVTMVKTKGAIGICFTLFGTSYLFINCHLTSDRDNDNSRKKNRLGDYFKVIQEMKLPKENHNSSKKPTDITAIFDCVFWCGDLNFRIERKRHAVEGKVSQITSEEFPNFEALLGGDQLLKYMTEGKIFGGFQEGRINFHPTFKFDVNQDTYDSSAKNRVPSYTDRIMFRCKKKNDITCMHYDAAMNIKISDHRPVYGQFETNIRPGRDNMIYAAGHFDRSVYLEANRRRAEKQPVKKKQSAVCSVQ